MRAETAERVVVASSVADAAVYRALAGLNPGLIYDPPLRRLFIACAELNDIGPFRWSLDDCDPLSIWPMTPPYSVRVRTAAVAVIAEVPFIVVEELVRDEGRFSVSRRWVDALRDAEKRRAALIDLEKARDRLLAGADPATVRAELTG